MLAPNARGRSVELSCAAEDPEEGSSAARLEDEESAPFIRPSSRHASASDGTLSEACASSTSGRIDGVLLSGAAAQTGAYFAGFVVLGFMVGLVGPTLPALRRHVGVSFDRLGLVFLARWAGSAVGSLAGGWVLDRTPGSHVPFAASVVVASAGCALVPGASQLGSLLGAFALMDLGLGVLICHGNTLCAWANASNPGPAVNVINGGFGAGAFCAPLIVYGGAPRRCRHHPRCERT